MADQKPPRITGDDRSVLVGLLRYQRGSFVRKLNGLGAADAVASPVASGTSLLWLVNHLADAEATWVLRRFAQLPESEVPSRHADTLTAAVDRYRAVTARVDEVVAASDLATACPSFDTEGAVNLRWILAHLLEETARHAGHADIIRELIDGCTGR